MRALLLVPLLGALLGASCYQPTFVSGQYKCDQSAECPPSFVCAAGRCVDAKDVSADLASAQEDASAGSDMGAGADLRPTTQPDLATADLAADLAGPATCTPLGTVGARDITACRAIFSGGNTSGLCPPTYRVCTADDAMLLDAAAGGLTCRSLIGFYAAQISASIKANTDVQCEATTVMSGWALIGCGSEVLAANAGLAGTRTVGNDCKKLKTILPCDGTVKGWTCTAGLADASHSNVDRGGLLCCKLP